MSHPTAEQIGRVEVDAYRCHHDSTRLDGTLDSCCMRCGTDGYWHNGHRHDVNG